MMFPPSILRLQIHDSEHRIGLWLPLILLWTVVLLLGILLAPIIITLAIILWPRGWGKPLLLVGPSMFRLFCALRGLNVRVEERPLERVTVRFI